MPPRWPRCSCICLQLRYELKRSYQTSRSFRLASAGGFRGAALRTCCHLPLAQASIPSRRFYTSTSALSARPTGSHVIDDYYAELLAQPLPASAATERPVVAPLPTPQAQAAIPPDPAHQTPAQRAAIVFGSRLLPPNVRKATLEEARARGEGEWLAGHWIPPRPPEPDNCCMSGCVNCVWDVYREDLESWAAARTEARMADRKQKAAKASSQLAKGIEGDEDGVGSGGDLDSIGLDEGEEGVEGIMSEIPVGIREFMRTEKRLRERHQQEAQSRAP